MQGQKKLTYKQSFFYILLVNAILVKNTHVKKGSTLNGDC
jgi:hypothetical protein